MKDADIKEGLWSLGKNDLSHCIMHRLHLISQVEWKNVETTCECGQTSVEKKKSLLANFTVHTQDQKSPEPLKASIPLPHDIQRHRSSSSELSSQNAPIGLTLL